MPPLLEEPELDEPPPLLEEPELDEPPLLLLVVQPTHTVDEERVPEWLWDDA